ncbi:histidine phosphatase family protein [Oculatella sp. LEGE 06141]|nr:histidine phosphatase family protein [Oculatella sp. LEGE 06141]
MAVLTCLFAGCAGVPESAAPQPSPSAAIAPAESPVVLPSEGDTSASVPDALAPIPLPQSEADLWRLLQQADRGYVVLMRHALAPGTGDPSNFQLQDCSTQRNLSSEGQAQARETGNAFRQRQIPVVKVLSSQWCRCLETAELMQLGAVEPFAPLNSFFRDPTTEAEQTAQVRQAIIENRLSPGVTIMVTHQVNVTAISDIFPQSGEMIVLHASDPDQVEVIGRLPAI